MRYVNISKGGSLSKIAKEEGISLNALLFTNANLDPRRIQIGQKIAIPESEEDLLAIADTHKKRVHKKVESKPDKAVGELPKKRCGKCEKLKIQQKLLTPSKYTRTQRKLTKVKAIVIHWVANTKSKAISNRNYFESLKHGKISYIDKRGKTHYRYASAHYIIGLQGEIIQCVPNNEQAYHVGAKKYKKYALQNLSSHPNNCTIGLELTHINDAGEFKKETLKSTACLCAKLLKEYGLTTKNIIRHYDVTGKICPRYFVNQPSEFEKFKKEVERLMK